MSNSEVIDVTLSKDYRGDAIGTRKTSRDVSTGETELPSEQFHFFWEFSSRANRKKRFSFSPAPEFLTKWKAPIFHVKPSPIFFQSSCKMERRLRENQDNGTNAQSLLQMWWNLWSIARF